MTAFARLGIAPSTLPMEAKLVAELPQGEGWQFEPKWDGFRCLAFRDGQDIALMSKSGKPLTRYFPEVVEAVGGMTEDRLVLDGELILPIGDILSFADLQLRLHPAASRITRLSRDTPALLMLFDCLQRGADVLLKKPLSVRRAALADVLQSDPPESFRLSPKTVDRIEAEGWLSASGGALDGIVAKHLKQAYEPGERGFFKVKLRRTADCVVGGFRYDRKGKALASLLLGLYDEGDHLHHVGFLSGFSEAQRSEILPLLQKLVGPPGFDVGSPGGPSRWNRGRCSEWEPLRPELVVEVGYDQVTGERFRHGASFTRWRPDKAPHQCRLDQLIPELRPAALAQLLAD